MATGCGALELVKIFIEININVHLMIDTKLYSVNRVILIIQIASQSTHDNSMSYSGLQHNQVLNTIK